MNLKKFFVIYNKICTFWQIHRYRRNAFNVNKLSQNRLLQVKSCFIYVKEQRFALHEHIFYVNVFQREYIESIEAENEKFSKELKKLRAARRQSL